MVFFRLCERQGQIKPTWGPGRNRALFYLRKTSGPGRPPVQAPPLSGTFEGGGCIHTFGIRAISGLWEAKKLKMRVNAAFFTKTADFPSFKVILYSKKNQLAAMGILMVRW